MTYGHKWDTTRVPTWTIHRRCKQGDTRAKPPSTGINPIEKQRKLPFHMGVNAPNVLIFHYQLAVSQQCVLLSEILPVPSGWLAS
jgi:hypothetical protein